MSITQFIRGPRKLSFRLLLRILLFSLAITVVFSAWQLYRDYRVDAQQVRSQVTEAGEGRLRVLGYALWNLDKVLLESQLKDMLLIPDLAYAKVESTDGLEMAHGQRPAPRWAWEKRFPVTFGAGERNEKLGELVLVGNMYRPYERLQERIDVVLAAEAANTFLVALFIVFIIDRFVTRHLAKIHAYVSNLRTDIDVAPLRLDRRRASADHRGDELDELADAINTMRESLKQELEARERAQEQAAYLAWYDALTGLPNRRLLSDRLGQLLERNRRSGEYGALFYFDLDRFKDINDTMGHSVGDEVLIDTARVVAGALRAEDTVARLGGDEYVVLLPRLDQQLEAASLSAEKVARDLSRRLAVPRQVHGTTVPCSASIGVVIFPLADEGPEAVLRAGDTAMYRAKARGGNTVVLYRPEMDAEILSRLDMERELRASVTADAVDLFYQPQVTRSGRIVGLEGLARWVRSGEFVSPTEFIALAEQSVLIHDLGERLLNRACQDVAWWMRQGLWADGMRVAVNVSPVQLREAGFCERVFAALNRHGVEPTRLELELTEGIMARDSPALREALESLRTAGVTVSIDDFGTGYSSLAYLKRLPADRLKIDQAFVRGLPDDRCDAAIVDAVCTMSRHMDLGLVAEGVESASQLAFLRERGCPVFQGYYFMAAMPAREISAYLHTGYVDSGEALAIRRRHDSS